jgi:hypothetical protein
MILHNAFVSKSRRLQHASPTQTQAMEFRFFINYLSG